MHVKSTDYIYIFFRPSGKLLVFTSTDSGRKYVISKEILHVFPNRYAITNILECQVTLQDIGRVSFGSLLTPTTRNTQHRNLKATRWETQDTNII